MVYHPAAVHYHSGSVALAIGTGVGLIGWYPVVGSKRVVEIAGVRSVEDNDATACAFDGWGDILPTAHEPEVIVL